MSIRTRMDRVTRVVPRSRPTLTTEDRAGSVPGEPALAAAPAKTVEIVVYAEDCILAGCVALTADRLSDMFNEGDTFELAGVRVDNLKGGPAFELPGVEVRRDEILLIHVGGPRGNAGRRHRTRQHPIVAKSGPYEIRGYVHSLPGTDAISSLRRRPPMFAMTDAVLEYTLQSKPQERRAGVLIVNREAMDWIVEGHDEDVLMPEIPVETGGARVKDFTGELFDGDADWNA